MANYLILCVDTAQNAIIEPWLSTADGASTDMLKFFVSDKNTCYYLANHGKKDTTTDGGIFKGYAIDHDRSQILYSGNGAAPNVHWPMAGSYISVQQDLEDIVVGNDLFAQLPLLYFREMGIVAISDSVFMLTEVRKRLGIPNRIHTDAALSRAWVHGMASQLLSTNTLIVGIQYCPVGSKIRIKAYDNALQCTIEKVLAPDIFLTNIADYRDSIVQNARKISSVIATLAHIPDTSTILSLSGGVDSRVCLAAVLPHVNQKCNFFSTGTTREKDYAIAKSLAEHFNFDFKAPPKQGFQAREQISSWFLSCAGLYDPLVSARGVFKDVRFILGGQGAEVYKGNYGWRPLSIIKPANVGHVSSIRPTIAKYRAELEKNKYVLPSILSHCSQIFTSISRSLCNKLRKSPKVEESISEAAYRETSHGLHSVGIAAENPWATEWHYLCFRNAIHAGRSTMNSLLGLSPLLQRELVGLTYSHCNMYPAPKDGSPSIVTDLLIALSPELAMMPFDDSKKNMPQSYVEERAKFLGTVKDVEPYTVIGEPCAVNSGTPKMFLKAITDRGFIGTFTQNSVKVLVEQGYETIPQGIRYAYDMPKYLVDNDLPTHFSTSSWQYMAAGKIMTFLLAD